MRTLIVLAILASPVIAAAQEHKLDTKDKLLAGANSVFSAMCAEKREAAKKATSVTTIRLSDQAVELWCTCAPAEMERLAAGLGEPISKETALGTYTQATSICTGKQMRTGIMAECANNQNISKPGKSEAYCACVNTRLSAKTDEQLYKELAPAHDKAVAREKARGSPPPFLEAFGLRKYGAGCEKAAMSGNTKNSPVGAK